MNVWDNHIAHLGRRFIVWELARVRPFKLAGVEIDGELVGGFTAAWHGCLAQKHAQVRIHSVVGVGRVPDGYKVPRLSHICVNSFYEFT